MPHSPFRDEDCVSADLFMFRMDKSRFHGISQEYVLDGPNQPRQTQQLGLACISHHHSPRPGADPARAGAEFPAALSESSCRPDLLLSRPLRAHDVDGAAGLDPAQGPARRIASPSSRTDSKKRSAAPSSSARYNRHDDWRLVRPAWSSTRPTDSPASRQRSWREATSPVLAGSPRRRQEPAWP